jgi:hypothetical protein
MDNDNKNINKINPIIDKEKSKKIIKLQREIFIPIISAKVIISFIFCEFYLSYAAYNKIDTPYIKISICLIVILFFYSYYLSVIIPATQTNVNKYFNNSKEIQNFNNSYWNYCQFCNSKKFIRCSHCRTCQQCILYRDHHCPYTANCIGFNNIQYFLNFLFWGIYAIGYYNITCIKFFLKKNNVNLNDGSIMPKYIKIFIIIDFIFNAMFFNGLVYLFFRTILIIYENFTTMEKERFPSLERNFFCYNIYKNGNKLRYNNNWNKGFLSHLYYSIGPTILHLFFPISKFKNYPLDENSNFFNYCKFPDKIQSLQYLIKNKKSNLNSFLDELGSNPDYFIKLSHDNYDGKIII